MDAGYQTYLTSRGFTEIPAPLLEEYTPLMSTGLGGFCVDAYRGTLAGSLDAAFIHSTYKGTEDDPGRERHFTLVIASIQEAVAFARNLSCRDRDVQDDLAHTVLGRFGDSREIELESIEFDRRYLLQAPAEIDQEWLRQLFSPSLVDWLTTSAPRGFCFELNEGHLCAALPEHVYDPDTVDQLLAAAGEVAQRTRDEALEQAGQAVEAGAKPLDEGFERLLDKVDYLADPPPSVSLAADRYHGIAMRRPGNVFRAVWAALRHLPSMGALTTIAVVTLVVVEGPGISDFAFWIIPPIVGTIIVLYLNVRRQARALAAKLGEAAFMRGYAKTHGLAVQDPTAFQAKNLRLKMPGAARQVAAGNLPGNSMRGAVAFVDRSVEKATQLYASSSDAMSGFARSLSVGQATYDVVVVEIPGSGPLPDPTPLLAQLSPLPQSAQLMSSEQMEMAFAASADTPAGSAAAAVPVAANQADALRDLGRSFQVMSGGQMQAAMATVSQPMATVDGRTLAYMRQSSDSLRSSEELDALCAQATELAGMLQRAN